MPYGFAYMIVTQVLFFIVTIGLVIWFIRNQQNPKKIIDKRLVFGEINKKEYCSLLKIMDNKGV